MAGVKVSSYWQTYPPTHPPFSKKRGFKAERIVVGNRVKFKSLMHYQTLSLNRQSLTSPPDSVFGLTGTSTCAVPIRHKALSVVETKSLSTLIATVCFCPTGVKLCAILDLGLYTLVTVLLLLKTLIHYHTQSYDHIWSYQMSLAWTNEIAYGMVSQLPWQLIRSDLVVGLSPRVDRDL